MRWLRRLEVGPVWLSALLGGVVTLLCYQYLVHELTYDRWDPALSRLVRIETTITPPGGQPIVTVGSSRGLAPWLRSIKDPAIERVTAFTQREIVAHAAGKQTVEHATFVDSEFFATVPVHWRGRGVDLLSQNDVVLSRGAAVRLFGTDLPLGKSISVPGVGNGTFTVAGVFTQPDRTHFKFEILLPRPRQETSATRLKDDWLALGDYTYARLRSAGDVSHVGSLLASTVDEQIEPVAAQGAIIPPSTIWTFALAPVSTIHLQGRGQGAIKPGGDIRALELIGGLVVCIAIAIAANLINHFVVVNSRRSREMAIRRLVGERHGMQSLKVAGSLCAASFALVLCSVAVAVPIGSLVVAPLTGNSLWSWESLYDSMPSILALAAAFSVSCALLATHALHRQDIAGLLRSGASGSRSDSRLRLAMFCVQVSLSAALAGGCLAAWKQLKALQDVPAGLTVKNIFVLLDGRYVTDFSDRIDTLRSEVSRQPQVKQVAFLGELWECPNTPNWRACPSRSSIRRTTVAASPSGITTGKLLLQQHDIR